MPRPPSLLREHTELGSVALTVSKTRLMVELVETGAGRRAAYVVHRSEGGRLLHLVSLTPAELTLLGERLQDAEREAAKRGWIPGARPTSDDRAPPPSSLPLFTSMEA